MYLDEFGEVGTMDGLGPLEHDDFSNLAGGMEHLSRYGEQHGVVWVVGEGEQADLAEDDDDEFEIFEDEDAEIDGEIGIPSDDEEFEILEDDNMEPIPTSVREGSWWSERTSWRSLGSPTTNHVATSTSSKTVSPDQSTRSRTPFQDECICQGKEFGFEPHEYSGDNSNHDQQSLSR